MNVPKQLFAKQRKRWVSHEKKTTRYTERDEKQRVEFVETLSNLPDDAEILYADESGFEEYYSRTYGYVPRGKRVYGDVPGTHFGRTSVVGAINAKNEFTAGFAFKGYMNGDLFVSWLEQIFVPSLVNPEKSVLTSLDDMSNKILPLYTFWKFKDWINKG